MQDKRIQCKLHCSKNLDRDGHEHKGLMSKGFYYRSSYEILERSHSKVQTECIEVTHTQPTLKNP